MRDNARKVIFVGSLFNCLLAIQLRLSMYRGELFDIVFVTTQKKVYQIFKSGIVGEIFDSVYFVDISKYSKKKWKVLQILSAEHAIRKMLGGDAPYWNEVFFWHPDAFLYSYLWMCERKHWAYNLHLYGDASAGYVKDCPSNSGLFGLALLNKVVEHKYGFAYISKKNYDIYLFKPQYACFKTERKLIEIPTIKTSDNEFKIIANKIFDYKPSRCQIKEKYIFFDEVWGELNAIEDRRNLIVLLKDYIGTENFVVKPHPRGDKKYYIELGVKVFEELIPWELICLNEDMSDKVFITTVSSAAIMPTMLFDILQRVYIVNYLDTKLPPVVKKSLLEIYEKMNKSGGSIITIFNSKEELKSKLINDMKLV